MRIVKLSANPAGSSSKILRGTSLPLPVEVDPLRAHGPLHHNPLIRLITTVALPMLRSSIHQITHLLWTVDILPINGYNNVWLVPHPVLGMPAVKPITGTTSVPKPVVVKSTLLTARRELPSLKYNIHH